MALTVSASSSDWPLQASDGECPLVWDKLGRQGQCLPAGWLGGGVRGQRSEARRSFLDRCERVAVLTLDLYDPLQRGPRLWARLLLRPLKAGVALQGDARAVNGAAQE